MVEARLAKGWTQRELAMRIGGTQNMISLLESGRQSSSTKIFKICRALGVLPPFAPVEDDLHWRWMDAGRELRARDQELFETMLGTIEKMAGTGPAADVGVKSLTEVTRKR